MNGKILISAFALIIVIFGAGLWYSQTRAYYYDVTDVTEISIQGEAFPVTEYRGIDADTSPLKMRACFTVDWDYWPTKESQTIAKPLGAPPQFDCFNAKQITDDLASYSATVILADENRPYGFDVFIVLYPDGNAYMWRQINACGEAAFVGDPLPDHCPPQPET